MVFKGFRQVLETTGLTFETGYIYFVRTNDAKTEGYIYFNGKKYGNIAELRTELEARLTEVESGLTQRIDDEAKIISAALNDLQNQIDAINSVSTEEINDLKNRMTSAETDIDELQTGLTSANSAIDALENRMTSAETDIDELQTGLTSANSAIDALENRMTSAETDIDALEEAISDLNTDLTSALTEAKAYTDTEVGKAKVTNFEYVSSGVSKELVITLGDGTEFKVDAKDFIKDGMLDSAELDEISGVTYLILTFNTDSGKEEIKLDVSSLIDIYTGDGKTIQVSDNTISAIMDQEGGVASHSALTATNTYIENVFTVEGDDVE